MNQYAANVETTVEIFAYWLDRDWSRVRQLGAYQIRPDEERPSNQFELWRRVWSGPLPCGAIVVTMQQPGRIRVEATQPMQFTGDGAPAAFIEPFALWVRWRFEDAVTVLDDDAASKAEPPAKMFGPAPAEIAAQLFQQGLTKDTDDWWLALLWWAKEYRRAYGEKSLTNETLWTIADVSETTFYRRQKAFGGKVTVNDSQ